MTISSATVQFWAEVELEQLAEDISYGHTAKSNDKPVGPHMLRITDIQDNRVDWNSVPYCEVPEEKKEALLLKNGDLVFARTGATVGKSFLIRGAIPDSVYASYLIRVRCIPDMDSCYLAHFFQSPSYWRQVTEMSAGIGQPNVNGSKLKRLLLPVAPKEEQKQIAAKLDELLAQVDSIKTRLDAIPAILKRFRQSVLAAAVSGRLTEDWRATHPECNSSSDLLDRIEKRRLVIWKQECERVGKKRKYKPPANGDANELMSLPESWEWVSVDRLASKVVDGVHKKPQYQAAGIPFVTVKNLTAGHGISFDNLNYVSEEDHRSFFKRANPEFGDILISKDGTLGVVRQVKTSIEFSIFVSVALVKPVLREMSDYLELAFSSLPVQAQMVGVGTGLQHIHLTDLRVDMIPVPPIEEQTEIVRQTQELLEFADQIDRRLSDAQSRVNKLTQSVLGRAFRGDLTADWREQNPDLISGENSAEALLERIKAASALVKPAKRVRRKASA